MRSVFSKKNEKKDDEVKTVCGILGEKSVTARLHDKIKFPGGQASGCQLVCMNDTAFESYGKTQSYNSNVSEEAMKKYTTVFNKLLSDKKHYCILGDMVLVWFALKSDDSAESSFFSCFFGNDSDKKANDKIAAIMKYARSGFTVDEKSIDDIIADKKAVFYIAGLTPNSSRICQKFMYKGNFGDMMSNLIKHQNDMLINENNTRPIFFSGIAKELISPKSNNEKVPSPLMSAIMLAALNNTKYPDALLSTVIRRVKTDSDEENKPYIKLNDTRVGIIKACLNRKNKKEEITMAWNEENKSPAYLCGGLFAVYEKIQQDSSGGNLNRTIKDSYFSSACSRPSSVFPKLAKLAQNHMRKLSEGSEIYYNKMLGDIMSELDGSFPATLNLDDQGRFIVGYYQMNKKLYTPNEKK
ncbi:type I-C CRISPR-associated protein Cas8c/Csd1 [Ruminococcus sp. HUN007]|uniref:type I-C CRISPR-associated protein Cas8c/Csd1 n=1 Tax=Ruminococcus sp. HUN007 TaxID=1514668 RepID=UPI0009DD39C8